MSRRGCKFQVYMNQAIPPGSAILLVIKRDGILWRDDNRGFITANDGRTINKTMIKTATFYRAHTHILDHIRLNVESS